MYKYVLLLLGGFLPVVLLLSAPPSAPKTVIAPGAGTITDTLKLLPVVPVIDAAMKDHLRAVYTNGLAQGADPQVFAKVGDSITDMSQFLHRVGCGSEVLDKYQELEATIDYFRTVRMPLTATSDTCGVANSFNRDSIASHGGWVVAAVLAKAADQPACAQADNYLNCEYKQIHPGIALIMFGTNSANVGNNLLEYEGLSEVVSETLASGIIPVLSTIPPRPHMLLTTPEIVKLNEQIAMVATQYNIPLLNYWRAMQDPNLVDGGISDDGIHPNTYQDTLSDVFTPEGLRYGFNVRNLTALQTLAKLKQVVLDNGAADPPGPIMYTASPTPTATFTPSVTPTRTPTATPTPVDFSDITASDYFYQPVQYLVAHNAVSGYEDDTFRPYNNTTRIQIVKIIVLLKDWELITPEQNTFSDVLPDNPFYAFVETAVDHSVISGSTNNEFNPYDNVTRGQLAKIVVTAEGWSLITPADPTFTDVQTDNTFYAFIETAVQHGVIGGYNDHTFRWSASATRGQIAKVVYLSDTEQGK